MRDDTGKVRINLTWSAEECEATSAFFLSLTQLFTPGRFERWRCGKEGPAVLSFLKVLFVLCRPADCSSACSSSWICLLRFWFGRKKDKSPNTKAECKRALSSHGGAPTEAAKALSRKYAPVSDPPRPAHWPNTARATDFLKLSPSRLLCRIQLGTTA